MKVKFSEHALKRMHERGIKQSDVEKFLVFPDKIEVSSIDKSRFLFKKVYYHKKYKKDHILMMICEKENGAIRVITIIDTSKISKYI